MRIDTITIHQEIDGTIAEAQVPLESADSWTAAGWTIGPAPTGDDRPPVAGVGSDGEAWRDYATRRGVDVDGLTRDEIIAAIAELDALEPATPDDPDVVDQTAADAPVGADPDVVNSDDAGTAPQGPSTTSPEEGDHHEP